MAVSLLGHSHGKSISIPRGRPGANRIRIHLLRMTDTLRIVRAGGFGSSHAGTVFTIMVIEHAATG